MQPKTLYTRRPHRLAVGPWNVACVPENYFVNMVSPGTLCSLFTIRFSARLAAFMAVWSMRSCAVLSVSLPSWSLVSTASCEGRAADLLELMFCSISLPPDCRNLSRLRRLPICATPAKPSNKTSTLGFSAAIMRRFDWKCPACQTTKSPSTMCMRLPS